MAFQFRNQVNGALQFQGTDRLVDGFGKGWDWANDARKNHLEAVHRDLMKDVGASASEGDYLGAAQKAFQGGDVKTGMGMNNYQANLENMSMNKMLKVQQFFHDAAGRADTPEKWASVVKMGKGIFGDEANQYADFSMRDAAVDDMAQSIKQLDLDIKRERLAKMRRGSDPMTAYDQRAAAIEKYGDDPNASYILGTGSAKAPTIKDMPDENGVKRPHEWDGTKWTPVGGMPKPGANLSPAQKKIDQEYAKDYAEFILGGGSADFQKNMGQLEGVARDLESGGEYTGPVLNWVPDTVMSAVNPKAIDARDQVEEVVQRNLRAILGAQFTENEGKRLIARAYNPALQEADNARRLRRLHTAMKSAFDAKMAAAKYFEDNGTMVGYKGSEVITLSDIEREFDRLERDDNAPPKQQGRLGGESNRQALIDQARDAISRGADPAKVKQRLQEMLGQ